MNRLNLSLQELRSLVLETLAPGAGCPQYDMVCKNVAELAIQKGISQSSDRYGHDRELFGPDKDRVREIIWHLIFEGVLAIGSNSSNTAWPWLRVTEYGERVIQSQQPVPHDPSGYLDRLSREIPNLDPIINRYVEESIRTYNINALLASTITLGCASEKALLLLIAAFRDAIADAAKREAFRNKTENKVIKRQFDEFQRSFSTIQGGLPGDLVDGLDIMLTGIFEMIRNNRNDAGHPTGKAIDRDYLFASLQVFIPYCKRVYQLIDYFHSNPI